MKNLLINPLFYVSMIALVGCSKTANNLGMQTEEEMQNLCNEVLEVSNLGIQTEEEIRKLRKEILDVLHGHGNAGERMQQLFDGLVENSMTGGRVDQDRILEVVCWLIKSGVNVDAKLLPWADQHGHTDVVGKVLLETKKR